MRKFIPLLFLALLHVAGCAKSDPLDDNVYAYEVRCEQCDIEYLDNKGSTISVKGQRGAWRKEFKNAFFQTLMIKGRSLTASSTAIQVHILWNGERLESQSGNQAATAQYHFSTVAPGSGTGSGTGSGSGSGSGSNTPSSSICGARTKKGGACQRKVAGGGRCWQHR